MAENIKVDIRSDFGKGFARRMRAESKIPAVLYGHGTEPVHLALPYHATALAARHSNALLELEIPNAENELAIIKDIQRHPLSRDILHIDLLIVKRGEKVEVDIPVTVEGEPQSPAVAVVDIQEITLLADALSLPEHIVVDVEGKVEGDAIYAGDLDLGDAELVTDPEFLVVSIQVPQVDEADLETPGSEDDEEAAEDAAEESSEGDDE
ncbi:50S ribosomal protein L25/general stress protein Ctc [Dermabacter hominis]|uniref:50S ribosomal protein L25/general stress protein Ctc n=1 Tax=Dermabacter TaxID=36739 RepID=UPI000353D4D1|nr:MULTISPECIES: 50S ribosomal protein L25/general stress protein Ctc [Dermabacter]EPH15823.1 ribosomal protein L25, Ctc-form [Dermabacter sp. HFH0086]MCT2056802.1 50S ribosomal protein L25/general stress protein Ctc [Dermabacter hominis]MCT2084265.1 50S ribosomal protein L25/general stress protein Ctc [Dermabacter hominis]MCT2092230.1 50S ribosomal protein L25/general stress protein Ctc [Dermabacter hominis]MCT2191221.1 50S ribosomal protein L25/general stress protein Ctc [Dermabacter hominis